MVKYGINTPNYTNQYTIDTLNKSFERYYERMDYEFITWDSVIETIHKRLSLKDLLFEIYDKYPINVLSFIFKKSIGQIEMKLKELNLKKDYDNGNKDLVKRVNGNIFKSAFDFKVIVSQEEDEVERWFLNNNNPQIYEKKNIDFCDINIPETINYYIEEENYEMIFKFMVVLCNFFRIPYQMSCSGKNIEFSLHFKNKNLIESNEYIKILKNNLKRIK